MAKPRKEKNPKHRAERFLDSSKQFLEAANRTIEPKVEKEKFIEATVPAIVCFSFAIELGLKSIFISEKHHMTSGHKLKELFCKLSEESKNSIESGVTLPSYPKYDPPKTFLEILEMHSNAFEGWRYCCEGKEKLIADPDFLYNLANRIQIVAAKFI